VAPITSLSDNLKKVKVFSWQTLVGLSLFSWLVAFAVSNPDMRYLINWLGWLFLTLGVAWGTEKTKIEVWDLELYLGPWLTGALACGIVLPRYLPGTAEFYLTLWPLISVAIATAPLFLKYQFDLINPWITPTNHKEAKSLPGDRQGFVNLALFGLLLSSWIQFHFLVQDWLTTYPSLLVDDFGRSGFVVKFPSRNPPVSLGARLLGQLQPVLEAEIGDKPWPEAEQWLQTIDQRRDQLWSQLQTSLLTQVAQDQAQEGDEDSGNGDADVDPVTPDTDSSFIAEPGERAELEAVAGLRQVLENERDLWDLQIDLLSIDDPSDTVKFQAYWRGPVSRRWSYFAERTCKIRRSPIAQITRDDGRRVEEISPVELGAGNPTRVECQPVEDRVWVSPDPVEVE
jgi:hypothetical protein